MPDPTPDPATGHAPPTDQHVLCAHPKPLGMLGWIAGYKLLKGAIATAGGVAALRLGHHNLIAAGNRWLVHFGVDPEGHVGAAVLRNLGHINVHHLHLTAFVLFLYALLYCIEGVGLFFEKRWAEWLTVVQTALLVPLEIYELIHRAGYFKLLALLASVTVVAYLLWRIRRDDQGEVQAGRPTNLR